jgi:heterodisulfide reductase subunit C
MTTAAVNETATNFVELVNAATPGTSHLEMCIQCGTCGGSCPSGADMDHTPRQLFAMIRADMRQQVLKSNTPWYCVSCYYCMVRCPQEIHITDVMYTLKRMALEQGYASREAAPDFSKTFISFVENYGRSFEVGLAAFYHIKHSPYKKLGLGTFALDLMTRNRLALTPDRIKGLSGLQAILKKAKDLALEEEKAGGIRAL